MTVAGYICGSLPYFQLTKQYTDFTNAGADLKCALFTDQADPSTWSCAADFANEVSGTGYDAGGLSLAYSLNDYGITATAIEWANATLTNIR
jgi:hypothetical protein